MPDVVRLRNVSGAALDVAPLGGRMVEADGSVDLAGVVLDQDGAVAEGVTWVEDAYLIRSGNPPVVRAWPHAHWRTDGRGPKTLTDNTVATEE